MKVLLGTAKRQGMVASKRVDELRLKEVEAGLLMEEMEAVRDDCGMLVQLIRHACGAALAAYRAIAFLLTVLRVDGSV